jgi:NAD-dependent SIR2 family protein deacetylase
MRYGLGDIAFFSIRNKKKIPCMRGGGVCAPSACVYVRRGDGIYNYYPTAGYKITYSVATLSYDNCYTNLWDYSNSLLCDLL